MRHQRNRTRIVSKIKYIIGSLIVFAVFSMYLIYYFRSDDINPVILERKLDHTEITKDVVEPLKKTRNLKGTIPFDAIFDLKGFSEENLKEYNIKNVEDVELIIPPTGLPPDNRKYDLNGVYTREYLEKVVKRDNEWKTEYDTNDLLPWTHVCESNKYCLPKKPAHVVQKPEIGCKEIIPILDEIRECVKKSGDDCSMILDAGFWRDVYEKELPDYGYVVIKVLKKKHEETRNLIRSYRETIVMEALANNPWVVHELGHCLPPKDDVFSYASVAIKQYSNLRDFLTSSKYRKLTLEILLNISWQLAKGVQAIHNLPYGPYVHADLQPRQFLINPEGKILINDLNRGKFLTYNSLTGEPCDYCGSTSKGRWRAPEEYARTPLNEKLDIFTLGNMIWSVFSDGDQPFQDFSKPDVYDRVMRGERPKLNKHMPPEIQRLIKRTWEHKPKNRPIIDVVAETLDNIIIQYENHPQLNTLVDDLDFALLEGDDM